MLRNEIEPGEWDRFAQASGASFQSARRWLRTWALVHWPHFRLRLFELYIDESGTPRKIGQCAVAVSPRNRLFLDRLQILRDDPALWCQAMAALLRELGPGHYEYGLYWSLEPPREDELRRIEGVAVMSVKPLTVHAVDFSRWPTWEAYARAISVNSRRNAHRAEVRLPDLTILVRQGRKAALQFLTLLRLRRAMCRRKRLPFRYWRSAASYVAMLARCPDSTVTAVVSAGGRALAAFCGIDFGSHTYFISGGSRHDNFGAAWRLQLAMLRRSYQRDRAARFVMGHVDYRTYQPERGKGLLRSRKALRVTEFPTSLVTFSYRLSTESPERAIAGSMPALESANGPVASKNLQT